MRRNETAIPEETLENICDPMFERYIGIDYSGAATPASSLKGWILGVP